MVSYDIRYPNITGENQTVQLKQMQSYLHQLVEQLNWALNAIDKQTSPDSSASVNSVKGGASKTDKSPEATFSEIKSLIIKSADIVNAYSEEISKRLEGSYVAVSDFGTYMQETSLDIEGNPTSITAIFNNLQTLQSEMEKVIDTQAYIKTGLLEETESGETIYGVEVGQTTNGFTKFARFTSGRLSFYDNNGTEVAYISNYRLYITDATVLGNLELGGYRIETTNGLAFRWVGG